MATMVCRSPQPCVDSQFIQTTWSLMASSPHIKLNAQPPPPFRSAFKSVFLDLDCVESLHECDESNRIVLTRNANYSVLLSSNGPKKSDSRGEEKSAVAIKDLDPDYVHPLVKRSRSTLSEKSLALCTENLGNETGADFVEDAIFSDLKVERSPTRKRVKSNDNQGNKKLFPPPLTTIAGVDSIRVRSYRENGRLIMEAVESPARLSYFHAERSHGRLRLSILKRSTPKFESEEESTEKEKEEEEEIKNDAVEVEGEVGNYEEDAGVKVKENGNLRGAEIEIEKLERPCRCNEAGEHHNFDENKNNNEMLSLTREPLPIWVSS
ncbi:protein FANTASTIC FOUR 3-like [Cucurbita pepo subsp. pepo]|uniref:protein FANTASTIC FOUR 3-like n=1 Tax=Cucurbita pepo subsp. pepo TaxID=3664 RepID=UPI000C9D5390|nr:protein FANTASTIC FOUR 3-like [Cucurbita pepo subsp. pepo]